MASACILVSMSESSAVSISTTESGVVVIAHDDGKANALSHATITDLKEAFAGATEAPAVVLGGRDGKFCAGFDLTEIQKGPEEARAMLKAGAELAIQIFQHPTPTVAASTGHALAMGAILLFSFDRRIGTVEGAKIGMNEVAIGMALPRFAIELGRERLSKRHLNSAANLAMIYGPEEAVDAGYLDRLDPDPLAAAIAEAEQLGASVHATAFAETRVRLRGEIAQRIKTGLATDVAEFQVHD
jgi:enoyl-CoA hydratase